MLAVHLSTQLITVKSKKSSVEEPYITILDALTLLTIPCSCSEQLKIPMFQVHSSPDDSMGCRNCDFLLQNMNI